MAEYLSKEEKLSLVRPLWKEVFTQDTEAFLDYYEAWKLEHNRVLAVWEEERISSMLHRNPYELALGRESAVCDYIVAVATREDRRHRGLMRRLLTKMAEDMKEERMPFSFLMPADEAIYLPFGFTNIWQKRREGAEPEALWQILSDDWELVKASEYEELAALSEQALAAGPEVYARRSAGYYESLAASLESEQGVLLWLLEGKERIGYTAAFPDGKWLELLIWKPGRQKVLAGAFGEGTMIMGRVMDPAAFGRSITAEEETGFFLELSDPLLASNNGTFRWKAGQNGSEVSAVSESGLGEDAVLSCGIDGLTAWLCGAKSLTQLAEEGLIRGTEKGLQAAEKLRPLRGVHLPEEV